MDHFSILCFVVVDQLRERSEERYNFISFLAVAAAAVVPFILSHFFFFFLAIVAKLLLAHFSNDQSHFSPPLSDHMPRLKAEKVAVFSVEVIWGQFLLLLLLFIPYLLNIIYTFDHFALVFVWLVSCCLLP